MHCRAPRQALQPGSIADEHRCPGHNDAAPPTGTAAEETTNPTHRGNTLSLNPDKGRPYSRSEACTTEGVYYDASATSINANWQIDGAVNKLIIADEMRMGRRPRNANETRTSPTKGGDVEALIARPLGRRGSLMSHRSCVPTRDAAVEMRPAITERSWWYSDWFPEAHLGGYSAFLPLTGNVRQFVCVPSCLVCPLSLV